MVVFKASGIHKTYGEVVALKDMDFTLQEGEIHYLVGANGCGKSTMCKIVAGVVVPDSGTIEIAGSQVPSLSPNEAKRLGVAVVYQELSLIPQLSVEENIMLGIEPKAKTSRLVDREGCRKTALHYLNYFKDVIPLDESYLDRLVSSLPIDEQQIVEIVKVLARNPRIIIFDEATASLHKQQVEAFFAILRELKSQGVSLIVISHKMEEITEVGDKVTIMRSGSLVGTVNVADATGDKIIHMMVGDKDLLKRKRTSDQLADAEPVLEVVNLNSSILRNVSFNLRYGEILGLGGLQGQGQSEVLLSLFGSHPCEMETIKIDGEEVSIRSTIEAMRHSLGYISGDRKKAGVFLTRPIFENLVLCHLIKDKRRLFSKNRLRRKLLPMLEKIGTKFGKLSDGANSLSGGNQQKIVIGRWLMTDPRILLLDDSTKGIDVGASKDFYGILEALCEQGVSVIWHSSEDLELLNNTDRVLVFDGGKIVDELEGDRLNEVELYKAALDSQRQRNIGEQT